MDVISFKAYIFAYSYTILYVHVSFNGLLL